MLNNRKKDGKGNGYNELGFDTKTSKQKSRLINKNGSFNVDRRKISRWSSISLYHALVSMSWKKFNLIVLLYFICAKWISVFGSNEHGQTVQDLNKLSDYEKYQF